MGLELLKKYLADNPLRIVDVGARWGIHKRWKRFSDVLEVIAFDADEKECERLNRESASRECKIKYLPFALGDIDNKKVSIHICRDPGCSSIFAPNIKLLKDYPYCSDFNVIETKEITLTRLDTVWKDINFLPDYIKIDTQGYELAILKGAGSLLKDILAAELEIEFVPLYQNQPLFAEVDLFMRENDFSLRGLKRSCWRRTSKQWCQTYRGGQLVHGDALYIANKILEYPDDLSLETVLKALIIFSAYNQDDLIENFIGAPVKALASFSNKERKILTKFLIKPRPFVSKLGRIPFYFCDHYGLRTIVNEGRPVSGGYWDDPDFF